MRARLPDPELARAMLSLPADHRLALYLADVEGYPYGKIAAMTAMF